MDKEEILKKSRKENSVDTGEYEQSIFAKASRRSLYVGFAVCIALIIAGRYMASPMVAFAGFAVHFSMQATLKLTIFAHLKEKIDLIFGIICVFMATISIGALVYLWMTSSY